MATAAQLPSPVGVYSPNRRTQITNIIMKLIKPFLAASIFAAFSMSAALADNCDKKDCDKDKEASVEFLANSCGGCDKGKKKDKGEEEAVLACDKSKKDKGEDEAVLAESCDKGKKKDCDKDEAALACDKSKKDKGEDEAVLA